MTARITPISERTLIRARTPSLNGVFFFPTKRRMKVSLNTGGWRKQTTGGKGYQNIHVLSLEGREPAPTTTLTSDLAVCQRVTLRLRNEEIFETNRRQLERYYHR